MHSGRNYENKNERGTVNVLNENVVAALDNCRISYRHSVHLIGVISHALGHSIENLVLNKSSYNMQRRKIRKEKSENIKTLFPNEKITAAVIHWDGKIISDNISCKQVDRLPIVLSNGKTEKLLDVPSLEDGKGLTQANAIFNALKDWGLCDVQALCCDTTNSNLGHKAGAAVLLEVFLERDLLYLPCRHHIFEIILAACFDVKLPGTEGPNVPLFKRFQKAWSTLDTTNFKNGLTGNESDERIAPALLNAIDSISDFARDYLNQQLPRDDYKELLELSLIFLGAVPISEVKFRKPGAFHHAR